MKAYYNEHDPYAAEWLRNLIACGAIAPGIVDERSISDVRPCDLDGFTQCHFFAGIGIWSAALRAAGWPDDKPVWTGSCPCQSLSIAGKRLGFDDERHLWPHWHWLIEQCRPKIVFGEQVASADGLGWADLVSSDLEATGYAAGFVDTCAAGFRSWHIRQRLYFAAEDNRSAERDAWADTARRYGGLVNSLGAGLERHCGHVADRSEPGWLDARPHRSIAEASAACGLDDPHGSRHFPSGERPEDQTRDETRVRGLEQGCGLGGLADSAGGGCRKERQDTGRISAGNCAQGAATGPDTSRPHDRLANTDGRDTGAERQQRGGQLGLQPQGGGCSERVANAGRKRLQHSGQPGKDDGAQGETQGETRQREWGGPDNWLSRTDVIADPSDGYWRDADWLWCRDGVWRPVESGTFPLASTAASRLGRLRAYGNGLDLAQATGFVRAYMTREQAEPMAGDLFEWSM